MVITAIAKQLLFQVKKPFRKVCMMNGKKKPPSGQNSPNELVCLLVTLASTNLYLVENRVAGYLLREHKVINLFHVALVFVRLS